MRRADKFQLFLDRCLGVHQPFREVRCLMEMNVLETLIILLDKLTKKTESHSLSFFILEIIFNSLQNFFNNYFFQMIEYFNE